MFEFKYNLNEVDEFLKKATGEYSLKKKMKETVVRIGGAKRIYEFAKNVEGLQPWDIRDLRAAILKTKNVEYMLKFFEEIDGFNFELNAEETIKKCKETEMYLDMVYYCVLMQLTGNEIDITPFENAIIEAKDPECIFYFALAVDGANIERLQDALIEACIESGDAEHIFKFAESVKGADIHKLCEAILKVDPPDARYLYLFCFVNDGIKGLDRKEIIALMWAVIKTGDAKYIYKFAKNVDGALFYELEKAIVATGDAEYIYKFAQLKQANPKLMYAALKATGNQKYIELFKKTIYIYNKQAKIGPIKFKKPAVPQAEGPVVTLNRSERDEDKR